MPESKPRPEYEDSFQKRARLESILKDIRMLDTLLEKDTQKIRDYFLRYEAKKKEIDALQKEELIDNQDLAEKENTLRLLPENSTNIEFVVNDIRLIRESLAAMIEKIQSLKEELLALEEEGVGLRGDYAGTSSTLELRQEEASELKRQIDELEDGDDNPTIPNGQN